MGFILSADYLCAQSFGWAKKFTGTVHTEGFETATDLSGNIISAGIFSGTMDFDPGPGTFNLTSVLTGDIYVSKLDAAGNFIWANGFLGIDTKDVTCIKTDNAGNVYITGWFNGVVDFDPGPAVYNLTANGTDIFICKLDPTGNFTWAIQMGGFNYDASLSMVIDTWGNVITTGSFSSTADFDPGSGTFDITAPINTQQVYISKLDSSGTFVWAKSFNTSSYSQGTAIGTDLLGNIYTSGWYNQVTDFDPGPATFNLTASGGKDIFLSKLDSNGNFVWAKKMSGSVDEETTAMNVDQTGFIWLTGVFKGTTDFDPGPSIYYLTASGNGSSFVMKLDPYGNFFWAKNLLANISLETSSIALDGSSNVIVAGTYLGSADFNPDTAIYYANYSFNFNGFICSLNASGNFRWAHKLTSLTDNNQINAIATDQFGSLFLTGKFQGGCDFDPGSGIFVLQSFISYNAFLWKLDYCNISTSMTSDTGCISYLSPSGEFTWTSSGIYNDIIPSASGCDSIITIDLTIQNVDTSVVVNDPTLTANATNATFQWINCNNGLIPGATNQNYTATSNGNYAVIVSQNGCADTSECFPITTVSFPESQPLNEINYFPNPVSDKLYINWGERIPDVNIIIFDFTGRIVFTKYLGSSSGTELELPFSSGFYHVQILSDSGYQGAFKIMKE